MDEVTIAVGQMDIALGDPETNAHIAEELAARAADQGASLLMLPELWGSGYDLGRAGELAAPLDEGLFAYTAELARRYRLAICGSLLERWNGGCYNTATLYDAEGRRRAVYRKIHLIGLMDEDVYLKAGGELSAVDLSWGTTALAICYDLRFPELFRRYALEGAQLILLPAEWPVQRIEHWRVLLRARAIENQCYVIACNRVGADRANTFGGRSAVIDPAGHVLAEAGDSSELLVATLDLSRIAEARRMLPVFRDRRPELYG